jgi:hypothetical protein
MCFMDVFAVVMYAGARSTRLRHRQSGHLERDNSGPG